MKKLFKNFSSERVLIDGFNLIYKFPELEEHMLRGNLHDAMNGLIEILKDYQAAAKKRIKVVFDGKKKEGNNLHYEKIGKIEVYYSLDYSADYLIMQFIKKDPRPKMTTVVTSDKEILFYINRFHAPSIKSEDFAKLIIEVLSPKQDIEDKSEKEIDVKLSDEELSFWEKLFKG